MRRMVFVVFAAGALASVGCGSGAPYAVTPLPGTTSVRSVALEEPSGAVLPPNSKASLAALFDPALRPLGLALDEAVLIDTSERRYVPSDTGTHLALYVRVTKQFSADDYANAFWATGALFTPDVFRRWPGLASYDVCVRQSGAGGAGTAPLVSQLRVDRDSASEVDWQLGALVDVLVASRTIQGVALTAAPPLDASGVWQNAERDATRRAGPARGTGSSLPTLDRPLNR